MDIVKFKERWVENLRSGKFKQGKGYLGKNGRYCCLGVALITKHELEGTKPSITNRGTLYVYPRNTGGLYGSELEEHFFSPLGKIKGSRCTLSFLNDSEMSFCNIADIIDKDPSSILRNYPKDEK